jgi:hypothetical protein
MDRLRGAGWRSRKTHHFSTWRSGFLLGLAIPALVSGLFQSKDCNLIGLRDFSPSYLRLPSRYQSGYTCVASFTLYIWNVHDPYGLRVYGGFECRGVGQFSDQLRLHFWYDHLAVHGTIYRCLHQSWMCARRWIIEKSSR